MNQKFFTLKQRQAFIHFFQDKSNIPGLILLIACYFIFFWKLDRGGIRQWDESSLAVNAFEMLMQGDPIVKYLDGQPDLINTKPMLAIWVIGICMKFLGYNEFALRLPSAICALATVIIIYAFCKYYLKQALAAFISGFVLITSIGFTGEHVARSGDYDAMLVLWVTVYSLSGLIYLNSEKRSKQILFLAITTIALICAVWTKGIAGLIPLPALFIYSLYGRKLKALLLSPHFYIAAVVFLTFSLGYYLLREFYNPGYLKAVLENELTGRYMDVVPGGTERSFTYYFVNMLSYRFIPWLYLLPFCWIAAYNSHKKQIGDFSLFSLIYLSFYLFVISYSKSKFNWYDAPFYPIAALTIGLGLSVLITAFLTYFSQRPRNTESAQLAQSLKGGLLSLILLSIFFLPYLNNLYYEIYQKGIPYRENDYAITDSAVVYRDYFRELEAVDLGPEVRQIKVVNNYRYNLPLLFYAEVAQLNKPYSFQLNWQDEPPNAIFQEKDIAINCDTFAVPGLQAQYLTKTLHRSGTCETLLIEGKKS